MLAPSPLATSTFPIAGDVPDLQAIVHDQALAIKDKAALIDAYQTILSNAQAAPNATGTGNSAGTTALTVTGIASGPIVVGSVVTGAGVPAATTITAVPPQGTTGAFTTSVATTLTNIALTFTPGGGAMPWPSVSDAPTLNQIMIDQTAVTRTQTALIQQYQTLLNDSGTAPPPTGP